MTNLGKPPKPPVPPSVRKIQGGCAITILAVIFVIALTTYCFAETERFLTIKLSQSRISLNPWKHAKDAMNATEIKLPVSEKFYNEVKVGDELMDKSFRWGSFITNGSTSSWSMKVVSK
jgi:hypothetical protein